MKAFVKAPPAGVNQALLMSTQFSKQQDHPYAWIACELEVIL